MRNIKSVCVYCASSPHVHRRYFEVAEELGRLLAQHRIRCIYGAGGQGLMGALADSILKEKGEITGIIPQFMFHNGWCHPRLKEVEITPDIHRRKERMAALSDGIIALPGGYGTMEELLEIITWKQLGLYLNPIIILNTDSYYTPLIGMLEQAVRERFIRPEDQSLWRAATTPQEAVEALYTTPVWNEEQHKYTTL